jgi:DNA uptake protein ComE-like DNA-binding protein
MTRRLTPRSILGISAVALTLAACSSDAREGADTAAVADTAALAPAADSATAATPAADGFLDPGAATRDQLAAVPGMTAAAADALIAGRPYADMLAVDKALAAHLGEAQRDSVYARVWKPIDLNKASKEEIELIPGVGARMSREFDEYRPYDNMAKFRREIGKYVDDAEVERLARYVEIR